MLQFKSHCTRVKAHGRRDVLAAFVVRHTLRETFCNTHESFTKRATDASIFFAAAIVLGSPYAAHADTNASAAQRVADVAQQQACNVTSVTHPNNLGDLSAGLFGGTNDMTDERDPITPFTLYGTSFKKYLIEQLQGEKIVARKKGFTVEACVGAVEVTQETPQFQGLPTGDKALYARERVCRKSEGQDLKDTCRAACEAACTNTLDGYARQVMDESGFALLGSDKARMAKSCTRNCSYECGKPGKAFDFVIPYRR